MTMEAPTKAFFAPDAAWFRQHLLAWFQTNARTFVWRHQHDPYAILVAEMMLHRTQARQVEPVYLRFLAAYPNPLALAQSDEREVAGILAPLGLAWRTANFIPLARTLVQVYDGQVPCERSALLALPGVGPYVADAVRVFGCGEAAALVDTNTVRVAGRFLGFVTDAESRRRRAVQVAIAALVDMAHPRDANLALLDFAALICRPKDPLCEQCPVATRCAFRHTLRPEPADLAELCRSPDQLTSVAGPDDPPG